MACMCKICGRIKGGDLDTSGWTNWDCSQCFTEELTGIDGTASPEERRGIRKKTIYEIGEAIMAGKARLLITMMLMLGYFVCFADNMSNYYTSGEAGTAVTVGSALSLKSNCKIIYPGDNLTTAYTWLKSSDRDSQMGALSSTTPRVLVLYPGKYTLTAQLVLDTDYVHLTGITGSPFDTIIYTHTTNSEAAVKQTADSIAMSNLTIQSAAYETPFTNAALEITNGKEGTDGVIDSQLSFDEIAITNHNAAIGDWVYIWGGDTPITNPDWYEVTAITGNELKIHKDATTTDTSNVNYEIVYKSRWSRYTNCRFINDNNYFSTHGKQANSGLYVSSGNFGGVFKNCIFSDFSCGITDYYDTLAEFYNCEFGDQCIGIDSEGVRINAVIENCTFGHASIGGCGQFGCTIGKYARISNVRTGGNSVANARNIESGALIRNVQAGLGSFSGVRSDTLTSGTGDNNGTVLTFTGATITGSAGFFKVAKGRTGQEVYITGTNVTAGFYEISDFDDTADTITLVATCGDGGGAMSNITLYYRSAQIKGVVELCNASFAIPTTITASAEFANEDATQGDVSGYVRNCYLEDVAVNLP